MKKNYLLFLLVAFLSLTFFTGCDVIGIKTGNIKVVNNTGFYLSSLEYRTSGGSWTSSSLASSIFSLASDNSISLLQPGTYEIRAKSAGYSDYYFTKSNIEVKGTVKYFV